MKTNNDMLHGGKLRPEYNQTWESCIYTAAEDRDFVKFHLGPALERAGLSRLKLMIWDHKPAS